MEVTIRRPRIADVPAIRQLIDEYAKSNILLDKPTVTLYEDMQEFWVAVQKSDDSVVGCGALHVMWHELAEIRSLAVRPDFHGRQVGHLLLAQLLDIAGELGIRRIFVLTFEVEFFRAHGFEPIDGTPIEPEVYAELLQSYDEGIAEFLDLERVKPNTLGNTRMLRRL